MAALTAVNTPPIQPIDLLVLEAKLASSIEKAEVKSFGKAGHGTPAHLANVAWHALLARKQLRR